MALKKSGTTAAPTTPEFEAEPEVTQATATPREPVTIDQPKEDVAAAKVEATVAIAVAQTGALMKPAGNKFKPVLKELDGAIVPEQAEVLPRLKSGSGCIKDADGTNYGTSIDLELLSYHKQYTISPGSDSDEAKKLVRFSYDGIHISGSGEKVDEYVKRLKEVEGYDKAARKEYLVLVGILEATEKKADGGLIGDLVQVSVSPQSAPSFHSYLMQQSVKVARGVADEATAAFIRIKAESKSKNGKDFTLLQIGERK